MSKANCTYKFQTINGPVTIQGMANMKAWLAVNGVEAIVRERAQLSDANKNAPTSGTPDAFAGRPNTGMQERAVRAVAGSPELAQFAEAGSEAHLSTLRVVDVFDNGNRVEYYDDAKGLMYSMQKYPRGERWTAWDVLPTEEGGNQVIGEFEHHKSFADAVQSIRGARISATAKARIARYGVIPNTWDGDAKKLAKALIDANVSIDRFATSTQSRSKYIYLDDGRKVRLADHDLPGTYDAPDYDFRYGGDIKRLVEQIKSATGNNGQFDPNAADIRFRSVREAVVGTVNDFRDVALPAGYRVNDLFGAPNKLDWWSKTVGTQYNLAQRSRAYKRVFDGAQEFLSDVSFYANEAADLAPTILPKLETLRDITKKPISAEDSKAISRPIFEGTLVWGRDPSTGQAVKMEVLEARAAQLDTQAKGQELIRRNLLDPKVLRMWQGMELDRYTALVENKYANEVLKPGTTFSDKELRELFKLNDGQIKLYREFRKAVNKSLSDLAVTDMVRFGGKDVAAVRDLALAAPSVRSAAKLLRDHLLEMADADPARRDVLVGTGNAMLDKAERAVELMDQGYAPLMRFGQYTVDVLDESGERVYFGMFETAREANKMARKMQENYPGGQVVQGTLSQEEYKLFAGVSPETVELFGNLLGLESSGDSASDAAFQEFLKKVKANRSAMKRLIHRKGIAGFNEDPGRVLAGFLYSNARQASSNVHMGALTEAVNDIPKTQGELKDHAVKLRDYVMNPQEEAQALRSVLFAQYLGGSVASALLNALQPVQVTFPWLSQFGGAAKAAKQMSAAIKDVMTKAKLDDRLAKALHRAEEEGIVSPQEIHQLQAQAAGRAALVGGDGTRAGDLLAAGNNALSRVSLAWGKLFGVAEQFNRRTTFIAAYRTALEQGMTDPAEFAKRAVQETQFVYNKGNKPRWARGAIGATLFTFKQYSVSYVELMHRMWSQGGPEGKKAALLGLAVLFLMSGADGLPFAEDVQDLIDGALQRMGYNASVRKAKEQFFIDLLGEGGAQFMERGLSGLPGSPVDVSGRMGLGNLIPGTGALYRKDNYSRDALEVLGPAGDLLGRAAQAGEKALKGEVLGARGALMTISPLASQNLGKAYEMYSTGMYLDRGGKKVLDTDGMDAFWKSIGIQPAGVSRIQKAGFEVQKGVAFNRLSESEIADKWARGVFLGDAELVSQARADLAEWNEKNPDMPIRIKPNQIAQRVKQMRMSKDERIAKSAPSEIRARVRAELEGAR